MKFVKFLQGFKDIFRVKYYLALLTNNHFFYKASRTDKCHDLIGPSNYQFVATYPPPLNLTVILDGKSSLTKTIQKYPYFDY
jgi:hypothetical protein